MFARRRTAARDTPSLVVVVNDRFGGDDAGGHADFRSGRRSGCRNSDGDWLWRGNRFDNHWFGWHRLRLGLGLGLGYRFGFWLDRARGGLLGSGLLDWRLGRRCGLAVARSLARYGLGSDSRRGLLCRSLLGRFRLFGLHVTGDAITNCATFEPIGLCFDQGAGVRLHANTHRLAQRHHFGIGHSELFGELVHAHVFRQNLVSLSLASAFRRIFR
jgi:hypothetical protein